MLVSVSLAFLVNYQPARVYDEGEPEKAVEYIKEVAWLLGKGVAASLYHSQSVHFARMIGFHCDAVVSDDFEQMGFAELHRQEVERFAPVAERNLFSSLRSGTNVTSEPEAGEEPLGEELPNMSPVVGNPELGN